jgi:hypothetical protein
MGMSIEIMNRKAKIKHLQPALGILQQCPKQELTINVFCSEIQLISCYFFHYIFFNISAVTHGFLA